MDDEESEHKPILKTDGYPFTLLGDDRISYTIIKTLGYKFLSSIIKINGEGAEFINREHPEEKEAIINCRIRLLEDEDKDYLIVINDDIYHPTPFVTVVPNKDYTYILFADAIEYCKKLGYNELFNKSRFTDIYDKNIRLKGMKYMKWWDTNKDNLNYRK